MKATGWVQKSLSPSTRKLSLYCNHKAVVPACCHKSKGGQRKDAISAEIKASLDLYFGGQGKEEKQMRLAVSELIFAVKSKEAADQLPLTAYFNSTMPSSSQW